MLHLQIEPQAFSALQMMKFAINHPQRFQKNFYVIAFLTAFIKVLIIVTIEVMNIFALLVKCNVIDCVTGYLKYYALVNFDSYMFSGMVGMPLYSQVSNNEILVIDRTTSLKNNWSAKTEFYSEKKHEANSEAAAHEAPPVHRN